MFNSKKAQLGLIELKFFAFGLIAGLIIGIALLIVHTKGIWKIPFL